MSLYDSVIFRCPCCDSVFEVQSRANVPQLKAYSQFEVPFKIADDILGQTVRCRECNTEFLVCCKSDPKFIALDLSKK